ncbi:hypothetical protein LSH36_1023g02083 [Paralvinella palmiformis]|uniref:Uncharacterized protein n=1 Tax=Paralvinella palmiformis TaxID=53620 RepID=A0AAD9IX39_9ANNE|nr:hypothetical protein LSH36_1023g02083 [Paralvinella palmiformis]
MYNSITGWYHNSWDRNLTKIPTNIPDTATYAALTHDGLTNADSWPELPLVKTIRLSHNYLAEFPDLKNVNQSLLVLYLDNNRISTISTVRLSALTALTDLYMSYNQLSTLPDVKMASLRSLSISDNEQMVTLPVLPLLGRTLIYLSIGHPMMTSVSLEFLMALPNVDSLHVVRSKIEEFPPLMLAIPKLRSLSLIDSHVRELPDDLFLVLSKLTKLDLTGNDLENFTDVCNIQVSQVRISLSGNRLYCDERLVPLKVAQISGHQRTAVRVDGYLTLQSRRYTSLDNVNYCTMPAVHKVFDGITQQACTMLCTRRADCEGWAYTPHTSTGLGVCGLMAWGRPSVSSLTFSISYISL